MNFKTTALLVGSVVASVSSIAQPVLMTELKAGDTWLSADISKASSEYKFKSVFFDDSAKYNADILDLKAISVMSNKQSFTPFIAVGFTRASGDSEKTIIRSAYTGGLFDLDEGRKAFMQAGYNKSDNTEVIRNSAIATLSFQMSESGNQMKNELSLNGTFQFKTDYENGGHSLGIENKTKFPLSSKIDFVANIGLMLTTELKLAGDITLNENSRNTFGGDLNIHPSKNFTIQLSMLQVSENGVWKDQGTEVDIDRETTTSSISLISRF